MQVYNEHKDQIVADNPEHSELSWDSSGNYFHSQRKICLLKNTKCDVKGIQALTPRSIMHKGLTYYKKLKTKKHLKFCLQSYVGI